MINKDWYRLPWPLEDSDAAVHRCLSDLREVTNRLLTFEREQFTPASVLYKLRFPDPYPGAGDLGMFELCRRPDGDTQIIITKPPKAPFRPFTDKENEFLDEVPLEEFKNQVGVVFMRVEQERKDAHRRCLTRQERFIKDLFTRLKWDPILQSLEPPSSDEDTDQQYEPTDKTKQRAAIFKKLKDEHPEWNYDTVALEACTLMNVDNFTGETVRNAYRAMMRAYPEQADEWTWTRSDRVR